MNTKQYEYLKIYESSGCISENFKEKGKETKTIIILIENRDQSGRIMFP